MQKKSANINALIVDFIWSMLRLYLVKLP